MALLPVCGSGADHVRIQFAGLLNAPGRKPAQLATTMLSMKASSVARLNKVWTVKMRAASLATEIGCAVQGDRDRWAGGEGYTRDAGAESLTGFVTSAPLVGASGACCSLTLGRSGSGSGGAEDDEARAAVAASRTFLVLLFFGCCWRCSWPCSWTCPRIAACKSVKNRLTSRCVSFSTRSMSSHSRASSCTACSSFRH